MWVDANCGNASSSLSRANQRCEFWVTAVTLYSLLAAGGASDRRSVDETRHRAEDREETAAEAMRGARRTAAVCCMQP